MFPISVIILGSSLVLSVAVGVPAVDVNKTCRLEAMQNGGVSSDLSACVRDQQDARDELLKRWNSFSAGDKSICTGMASTSYLPGYVELLTCLEMFQFAKVPSAGAE